MKEFKKWHLVFFAIFLIVAIGLKVWQYRWDSVKLEFKGEEINVLLAETDYHRIRGLGKRKSLGKYDGMIFLNFNIDRPVIVMRDMNFPIDIVWFYDGKVVDIAKNIQPEDVSEANLTRYYPRAKADVVLELPAGWADREEVKIGDSIAISGD